MKIYAGRREDILKRKEEYEADKSARQSRYDKQYAEYKNAYHGFVNGIKDIVRAAIGQTSLDLEITAEAYDGLRVCIRDENHKFDEDYALSWSYEASLDRNGDVKRESSSWSGLNAVTDAALDNLKEIVRVLDRIKSIDWENILRQVGPEYADYVKENDPKFDRDAPDFDLELRLAEIEDTIGKDVALRGIDRSGKYYRFNVLYQVVKESPAQYTVYEGTDWNGVPKFTSIPYRVNKTKFAEQCIPEQIETISLEKGE